MGTATFKGGIHPYEGKDLSKDKPTTVLMPKGDMVFPMAQHIGKPAMPLVSKGDYVRMGQKIGEADGMVSANIISSVSGTVKAVEPRMTVSGAMVLSVIIENDNNYSAIEGLGEQRDYTKLSKSEIRDIIKEAGLVGLGGAAFPTHVKLTPKDDNKIDYVIVNAAECEPYLTSDYRMLMEEPEKIASGLKIELSLFPNAKGIIAIEDNKPDAIIKMQEVVKNEPRIEVKALKTKYPQGGERWLISACTGRRINSSLLPLNVGCIVNNVDTIISIHMAVAESTPLMRRIVTVTGDAVKDPRNFIVKTGTNFSELIEAAGGFTREPEKIISGGPMMGQALYSLDIPVTKTSSAILAYGRDRAAKMQPAACIRCGRCVEACPSRIVPQKLYEYSIRFDGESFEKYNGMECCDCGCCTFVCPAKLNLNQSFKEMRASILNNRKK
ncbi:electron transport complex subunit RsxC [Anaerocolumna sp. AGMB13025]|uniref:electron transport complex subunit RsxC n=1 Tax=Anaerocolumna sp. AGMB13025 TaxID=3039116 RepID=UPI00241FC2D3|nr:electron transport complex subunit RsxC [Anaerocolumna sp. AGMB13025]WFR57785.1 electron transport complex subunit RsxC [Anaerocolumna sp. AGMB13025]